MTTVINSPNMNLPVPVVGVDPGPDWAQQLNNCMALIDSHQHAPGFGVPITPAGLNISSDLPFLGNNATALRSVRFTSQSANLGGASDIGCLYESGVDLWYNDGAGNQIRITQSGSVTGASGTITGLPSGTAGANYNAGLSTFVFTSATNKPAYFDAASILLRNFSVSSHALTLSPPNAMGADFTITLPSIGGSNSFVTMDTSGTQSASVSLTGGVTGSMVANNTLTNNKLAAGLQMVTASLTPVANAVTMDVSVANNFYVSVGSAMTLTVNVTNFIDGQAATIAINANGHAVTVVFSPTLKWPYAYQPPQSVGTDLYTIIYNNVTGLYYCAVSQDY